MFLKLGVGGISGSTEGSTTRKTGISSSMGVSLGEILNFYLNRECLWKTRNSCLGSSLSSKHGIERF